MINDTDGEDQKMKGMGVYSTGGKMGFVFFLSLKEKERKSSVR